MNVCKGCKKEQELVNKFFKLCKLCNNKRLKESKRDKSSNLLTRDLKSSRGEIKHISRKIEKVSRVRKIKDFNNTITKIQEDDAFYKLCFDKSKHKCEECNETLPQEFLNEEGRVNARWRYSHIIPKSIAPHLRHDLNNINDLCLACHTKWDFGDKKSMKIYVKNAKKFPQFLK